MQKVSMQNTKRSKAQAKPSLELPFEKKQGPFFENSYQKVSMQTAACSGEKIANFELNISPFVNSPKEQLRIYKKKNTFQLPPQKQASLKDLKGTVDQLKQTLESCTYQRDVSKTLASWLPQRDKTIQSQTLEIKDIENKIKTQSEIIQSQKLQIEELRKRLQLKVDQGQQTKAKLIDLQTLLDSQSSMQSKLRVQNTDTQNQLLAQINELKKRCSVKDKRILELEQNIKDQYELIKQQECTGIEAQVIINAQDNQIKQLAETLQNVKSQVDYMVKSRNQNGTQKQDYNGMNNRQQSFTY